MAALLPALLAGAVLGVVAEDVGAPLVAQPMLGGLAFALAAVATAARARRPLVLAAFVAALSFGAWRGALVGLPGGPGSVQAAVGDESRTIEGTVTDDPRPHGERQQVVLDQVSLEDEGGAPQPAAGRVLLWLPRGLLVGAGDRLRFDSALEQPRVFDGFAYRAYLARQNIAAIASARRADVVAHELPPIAEAMHAARGWLLHGLNQLVPEPEAALAAGIVLGVRSGIAPAINERSRAPG